MRQTFENGVCQPLRFRQKNKINVKGENKNVFLTVRTDSADTAHTISNLKNIFENSAQPENTQEDNYGKTD